MIGPGEGTDAVYELTAVPSRFPVDSLQYRAVFANGTEWFGFLSEATPVDAEDGVRRIPAGPGDSLAVGDRIVVEHASPVRFQILNGERMLVSVPACAPP